MEKLILSKEQHEQITALKLEGLALKIKAEYLFDEWKKAEEREKNVEKSAIMEKVFVYEEDFCDKKKGERITRAFDSYCMGEDIFKKEYLPIMQKKWQELYGLEYPLNYTPTFSEYHRPYLQAQKEYRKIAVRFLEICGRTDEAKKFDEMLNGYLPEKYADRLDKLNDQFLASTV